MPERLQRYEFKKLLPDALALPAPGDEYFEMETAKAFHYTWAEWLAEDPLLRAKMMAHELHKGMRDTYLFEQRQASAERGGDRPKTPAPWETIREKFFR